MVPQPVFKSYTQTGEDCRVQLQGLLAPIGSEQIIRQHLEEIIMGRQPSIPTHVPLMCFLVTQETEQL